MFLGVLLQFVLDLLVIVVDEDDGGEGVFGLNVAICAAEHYFNTNSIYYFKLKIRINFNSISSCFIFITMRRRSYIF